MIVLATLSITASIAFWRSLTAEGEQTVTMQVDYEDATLCAKFGFVTKEHGCNLGRLEPRHSQEE
jgi:hypothetical protein